MSRVWAWWSILQNNRDGMNWVMISIFCVNLLLWFLLKKKRTSQAGWLALLSAVIFAGLILETPFQKVYWLNGWGWHDLFLVLFFLLLLVLMLGALGLKKGVLALVGNGLFAALLPLVMLIFFGVGRSVTVELDNTQGTTGLVTKDVVLQQVRKATPNGSENGISYSSLTFLLVGLDPESGRYLWSMTRKGNDALIGVVNNQLLLVSEQSQTISFLHPKTGKASQTMATFWKKFPQLKSLMSYQARDYRILNEAEWATFGTDNHYYRINMKTGKLKREDDLKKVFEQQNSETNVIASKLAATFSDKIEPKLVALLANQQLVSFKDRRNATDLRLALTQPGSSTVQWQINLADVIPHNQLTPEIRYEGTVGGQIWLYYKGYTLSIKQTTGAVHMVYDLKWNQRIE